MTTMSPSLTASAKNLEHSTGSKFEATPRKKKLEEPDDPVSGAFGAILSAHRPALESRFGEFGGASARQMFEPTPDDSSSGHTAKLKSELMSDELHPVSKEAVPADTSQKSKGDRGDSAARVHGQPASVGTPDSEPFEPETNTRMNSRNSLSPRNPYSLEVGERPSVKTLESPVMVAPMVKPSTSTTTTEAPSTISISEPPLRNGGTAAEQIGNALKESLGKPVGANGVALRVGEVRGSQKPQAGPEHSSDLKTGGEKKASPGITQEDGAKPTEARFEEIVRSIRLQLGGRRSSARLLLHPPELGHIRIDVRLKDGDLRIDVQTETENAKQLLSDRASALKAALEAHGLQVGRFEVTSLVSMVEPSDLSPRHRSSGPERRTVRKDSRELSDPRDGVLVRGGSRRLDVSV